MNFEQFKPVSKGINQKDSYTIQAGEKTNGYFTGIIYFNGGMRDSLNLTEYKFIELYTDKENRLIAVKPTNQPSECTRAIRKNGNLRFITCSSWLRTAVSDLGYPERGSGRYEQLDDGLIVLHKPIPPVGKERK